MNSLDNLILDISAHLYDQPFGHNMQLLEDRDL